MDWLRHEKSHKNCYIVLMLAENKVTSGQRWVKIFGHDGWDLFREKRASSN